MSAPGAQRYTDLDLRVDPTLIGVAVTYAQRYRGEWDVMVAARELALATGNLPLAVARAVLNIARSDPRWADQLPAPQSSTFVGPFPHRLVPPERTPSDADPPDEYDPDEYPEPIHNPPRRLRVVREQYRPPFAVKATWKLRYGVAPGWNSRPQHTVYHLLDPGRSEIRCYPLADPDHRFGVRIVWVCGRTTSTHQLLAEPPEGLPLCATCSRVQADRERHG